MGAGKILIVDDEVDALDNCRRILSRLGYDCATEHDPLRDDGARYAELLDAAGVPVELCNEPHMVHGYVNFGLVVPAAAEATSRAARRRPLFSTIPARC